MRLSVSDNYKQLRLCKSNVILKLNVSMDSGVTCLNTGDFGLDTKLSHIGWYRFDSIKEREDNLGGVINEFKEFYNVDGVLIYYLPFNEILLKRS